MNLEELKEKIKEANPDRLEEDFIGTDKADNDLFGYVCRLSDVLLAIQFWDIEVDLTNFSKKLHNNSLGIKPYVLYIRRGNPVTWDLRNDDLEKQSPETIEFLTKLLL